LPVPEVESDELRSEEVMSLRKLEPRELYVIERRKRRGRIWRATVEANASRSWIVDRISQMHTQTRDHLRIKVYGPVSARNVACSSPEEKR
jgi:hypothetical protein